MWRLFHFSVVIFLCIIFPQNARSLPALMRSRNYTSLFPSHNNAARNLDNQILSKWTASALKFFDFHRCVLSNIASSEDECFRLHQVQRSRIAVYLGISPKTSVSIEDGKLENYRTSDQKVVSIFPDSNTPKDGGIHDAILVLDPYPYSNFGHLVAVFYIDLEVDSKNCKEDHQIYTTDETCITVAKKPRCPNRLERYTGGRRCHIDFLPTVYLAERFTAVSSSHASFLPTGPNPTDVGGTHFTYDLLNCVNLPGFALCPTLRPLDDTRRVLCDASAANSKRCDTSHTGVGTRCKLFQTCDRGVLIGGGWNRLHSDTKSFDNIIKMQDSLSAMGFLQENVKTFYGNGKTRVSLPALGKSVKSLYDNSSYFSSAMKTGLRGHLRTICETKLCSDTLLIYLNNPTTIYGDMLLWDTDYDGMLVDELEVYTVKEFLSDILGCEARRVIVIVDQSNSDILLNSLKDSNEHTNVFLFTAGSGNQVTTNGEFTRLWAKHSDSSICIKNIYQNVISEMVDSSPSSFMPTSGISSKVSLVGAPCDLNPPVSTRELKSLYESCQNVPTSVWFSAIFEDAGNSDYDLNLGVDGSEEYSPNARRS